MNTKKKDKIGRVLLIAIIIAAIIFISGWLIVAGMPEAKAMDKYSSRADRLDRIQHKLFNLLKVGGNYMVIEDGKQVKIDTIVQCFTIQAGIDTATVRKAIMLEGDNIIDHKEKTFYSNNLLWTWQLETKIIVYYDQWYGVFKRCEVSVAGPKIGYFIILFILAAIVCGLCIVISWRFDVGRKVFKLEIFGLFYSFIFAIIDVILTFSIYEQSYWTCGIYFLLSMVVGFFFGYLRQRGNIKLYKEEKQKKFH